jgi:protein gp37
MGYNMTPRLVDTELTGHLVEGKTIFVGSASDMFGAWVPMEWIVKVLEHCRESQNTYFFQSKCPMRFLEVLDSFPMPNDVIFGTTIETNRDTLVATKAPVMIRRAMAVGSLPTGVERMVSIEPIIDFDHDPMVALIRMCKPTFVSVGADSKGNHLPEPPKEKVSDLIFELSTFTEVRRKPNLRRLLP